MSDRATAQKLLALALHDSAPDGEKAAAALGFCRIVKRLGLLDGSESEAKATTRAYAPPAPAPPDEPDAPHGPTGLGRLGWWWVVLGRTRFCRACMRTKDPRKPKLKPGVIQAGTKAAERKGEYQHEDCHRKWGG